MIVSSQMFQCAVIQTYAAVWSFAVRSFVSLESYKSLKAIDAERELAAVALDESQRKTDSVQIAEPPTQMSLQCSI